MIEKHFTNYDDAVEWMNRVLDMEINQQGKADFYIEFRYVNLGWQVAIWDETDE